MSKNINPPTFTHHYSIKTVNAEIIKAGYSLSVFDGDYYLHRKKRGQPDGDVRQIFKTKQAAFNEANTILTEYWRTQK